MVDIFHLRGFIEKEIDSVLTDKKLDSLNAIFERVQPAIKNREDAVLGCIIGWIYHSVAVYLIIQRQQPNEKVLEEVGKAIDKRLLEIKGRIFETFR